MSQHGLINSLFSTVFWLLGSAAAKLNNRGIGLIAVDAVEIIDECPNKLLDSVLLSNGGRLIIPDS